MRKIGLVLAALACYILSHTQPSKNNPVNNNLLWRISGNGLKAPSYLFGTIHLTDKKVFFFGDSLYKALEQTQGFAAELDLNRLGTQMINKVISDQEQKLATEPVKVKDAVSAELWELYKGPLQERFYKPAENITLDDLDEAESALQTAILKKGDMPTFLDAYLFGIARKLGKSVGGLEELQDQLEHVDSEEVEDKIQKALFDDKYYRTGIDWMIRMYLGQKLDSIDALTYREEQSGKKDYIMIKRNIKMARRMDSLASLRSTLFAVGAAHLPGDSGVISLLRSRGYTLTPVISSRKINPDKYVYKAIETPWEKVAIRDNAYGIQMPGTAEGMDVFESMGLDMKMFYDISFMKMYITFNLDLPEERKKLGADSLYKIFRSRYASKGKLSNEKDVNINGTAGKEFIIQTSDGDMVFQLFLPGLDRIILNGVASFTGKTLMDAESKRFFQSFVYDKDFRRPETPAVGWSIQQYPQHAFTVEMPSKPRETRDVQSTEGKIVHHYQYVDIKTQVFFGMNISAVKEGLFETVDSSSLAAVKDQLKEALSGATILDSSFLTMQGYPGYKVSMAGKAEGDLVEISTLTIARGNRKYYLFTVHLPNDEGRQIAGRFLSSFTLLPYDFKEWKTVRSPNGSFSVHSAFPLKKIETIENDIHPLAKRFIVYDSVLSATLYIDQTDIPAWFSWDSDTAFLRKRSRQYMNLNDSMAGYKMSSRGNLKIADFRVITPGRFLIKRVKLVLNGSELYELFSHFDSRDLDQVYARFFDDFAISQERSRPAPTTTALQEIGKMQDKMHLEELKVAKLWWNDINFTAADIPALQTMMLRLYPDFDSTYTDNFNKKILDKLEELDSLHSFIGFIRNNYPKIEPAQEYIKPYLISYLSRILTKESYTLLNELLFTHRLTAGQPLYFEHAFYDSLQLTASLFPGLMQYAGQESLDHYIISITAWLLDSNRINRADLKPYAKGFIKSAAKALDKDKEYIEEYADYYYDYIKILGALNSAESNTLLNKLAKIDNRGLRYHTLIAQLTNGQPVDNRTVYTMATTDEYRHRLYEDLKKTGKLKLFPAEYLSQAELGKSKVFEEGTDEESFPTTIDYKGERLIVYKGRQQRFFLYKVIYDAIGADSYLGIAGPYPLNPKDYSSTHERTGIFWNEQFDGKKLDKFFRDYMKELDQLVKEYEEVVPPPPPRADTSKN